MQKGLMRRTMIVAVCGMLWISCQGCSGDGDLPVAGQGASVQMKDPAAKAAQARFRSGKTGFGVAHPTGATASPSGAGN